MAPTEKNIFDNLSFTYSLNSDAVVSLLSELRVEDSDLCGKKKEYAVLNSKLPCPGV